MKGCLGLCFEALVLSLTIDQPHIRAIEAYVGFVEVLLAGQAGQRQSRHAHSLKPQHLQIAERCMKTCGRTGFIMHAGFSVGLCDTQSYHTHIDALAYYRKSSPIFSVSKGCSTRSCFQGFT